MSPGCREPTARRRYIPPASRRDMGRYGSGAAWSWSRRAAHDRKLQAWSRRHGLQSLAVGGRRRKWPTAPRRQPGGATAPHPPPRHTGLVKSASTDATLAGRQRDHLRCHLQPTDAQQSRRGSGMEASDGYARNNSTCPQVGHTRTSSGRRVAPSWFKLPSSIPPRPVAPPTGNCNTPPYSQGAFGTAGR